ncbi:MAG: hypothetical protein WED11_09650 [Natronospirillum sp.]
MASGLLLAIALCLPDTVTGESPEASTATAEDNGKQNLQAVDWQNIPRLPEPSQQIEEVLKERQQNADASPSHDDYPSVSGCDPLEGDLEALPLVDRTHRIVSEALCNPAAQLDSNLANIEVIDAETVDAGNVTEPASSGTTLLKLTLQTDVQQDAMPKFGLNLSASVSLPLLYQRVSVFAAHHAERIEEALEDDSPRVIWVARPMLYIAQQTDIGLSGFHPFIRIRIPYQRELADQVGLRLQPEAYWRWNDGFGLGTELQLQYPQDADGGLVLNHRIETNEALAAADQGWRWSNALIYRHRLEERSTATVRSEVNGFSEPTWQTHTLRTDLRLGRSLGRPWFYVEAEPYLQWLRSDGFEFTPGIIFRLEVQVGDYPLRDSL